MKSIIISYGLPASGKTELFKQLVEKQENTYHLANADHPNAKQHGVLYMMSHYHSINLVDTSITTNAELVQLLKQFPDSYTNFWIYFFPENREQCLENDRCRLHGPLSQEAIRVLPFETPDLHALQAQFPQFQFKLEEKPVYVMQDYQKFAGFNGIKLVKPEDYCYLHKEERKWLASESWTISGSTRSYDQDWNDSWSAEQDYHEDPVPFQELDDLLFKLCPEISYLKAKKIQNLVKTETYEESDYYSKETKQRYIIDVQSLYELLITLEIVHV